MRCSACGVALPVLGILSAVAVFTAHSSTTTDSKLTAATGMVLAETRGTEAGTAIGEANVGAPTATNMNNWQETAPRRGSIRRL